MRIWASPCFQLHLCLEKNKQHKVKWQIKKQQQQQQRNNIRLIFTIMRCGEHKRAAVWSSMQSNIWLSRLSDDSSISRPASGLSEAKIISDSMTKPPYQCLFFRKRKKKKAQRCIAGRRTFDVIQPPTEELMRRCGSHLTFVKRRPYCIFLPHILSVANYCGCRSKQFKNLYLGKRWEKIKKEELLWDLGHGALQI